MKYIVQGNYSKFKITLTQKSGELIQPYIPTATDEVNISLRGARVYEYKEYEQAENVLTFTDNGCLRVGMYELEVRIIDSEQHRLRCMYRDQVRVVASNDDIPTNASFTDDDVQLSGQFDIVASTEIVVDDELSDTSENPVQNKVVTAALNAKGDNIDVYEDAEDEVLVYRVDLLRGNTTLSTAIIPYATQNDGGLMSATDKSKLAGIEAGANKTLFDNVPTEGSAKAVTSGGMFDYYRGAFFDFNYTPTAEAWEVSFLDKENNERLSITFDCANTVDGIAGLMSLADKTKLDALPTNADLTTALNGKEDKVAIEAPVNSVDATQPITTLATETGKYYRIDVAVETLAITLPTITDNTKVQNVVLYLKGGTTPAVTFSGGTIYYQSGFAIEAGKTYEVNCLYNGVAWVVAAVEIDEV